MFVLSPELQIDLSKDPYRTEGLRVFIAGQTGAGKSYTLMKILEEAHQEKTQFVLLDPHGEGHVLSELGDDVLVASERIGIPVVEDAIPVYVDVLKRGSSLVIDLSKYFYKSKIAFNAFVEKFIREFLSEWSDVRRPILFAMDEAHEFAPQAKDKGSKQRVDLCGELATGGRKLGVMLCFATQRPAKIDKTPITQANIRLVGKLTGTHDYNAFKEYFGKAAGFKQVRSLSSGQFYVISGTEVQLTRVNLRITTDAGATPDAAPILSAKQQVSLKELGKLIEKAVKTAQEEQDQSSQMKARIAELERRVEKHKDGKKDLQKKLDMVEFIADKFGTAKVEGKIEVPQEVVDAKTEFDKEIVKLKKRMQKELNLKDVEIDRLDLQVKDLLEGIKTYQSFSNSLREIIGDWPETIIKYDRDLVDEITQKVVARVGTGGAVYEVAPLEALKLDTEKEIHAKIIGLIDGLSPTSKRILAYLTAAGQRKKTEMCRTLWNSDGGTAFTNMTEALTELSAKKLVYANKKGYGARLKPVIDERVAGLDLDATSIKQHVVEHLRMSTKGE